ncbi:hypothetical protein EN866_32845 [Mesorhizobium sp. M2D.F.Ca.ET.223.01.1.1]|uniref:hypothetical protein n=1 Tax=Mesorhizobium sp. M2D.F.Ca.ET.223.01.1.1 TaxID=2563940 RepID=UPI0010922CAB|nr:hypothetical protein [Mesorhizobium sp. M2D.F.Ca.ET.223.01.1.1]TGR84596.1 hypothetical protein EN866_32845 [Mesorhizobium sp. M2D.F.Ca.ET.223.01.1.1]TGT64292.1 hypothetical protein EN802_32910 [bacterium M00.F.Ca.ET.159.01.1.1]TGT79228.1 hypothetical protein EN800_32255 [bacterium M00.F.Ca.ET.157.01.1.1]
MTPILVRDLLMNMLLGLTALVVLVLAQINPIAKNNPDSTKPPGDIMVCIFWQGGHDVDLWGTAPGQSKATGYSNKNGEVLDLVRDDLGKDALTRPRTECQFARGLPDGRWVFNLHGFSINEPEVLVHAEIRLGSEYGFSLLLERDLTIKQRQERTIAQFQLRDGKVVPGSVNEVAVPLRSAQ